MFYNKKHIALRTAYFFSTAAISGAVGGLVSFGVGQMDGITGWSGWRWTILIIGIPTLLTGFVIPFVLPNSVESAKFLTDQDRRNMHLLRQAEPDQTKSGQEMNREDFMEGVKDWKTYAFAFAHYCVNTVLYGFSVFLPTIIQQIGNWTPSEVQALTIPVYMLGAITYIVCASISDSIAIRGYFVIGGLLVMILGFVFLIVNQGVGLSFAGCFLVAMGLYTCGGTALSWLTSNTPRYGKRAFASGLQLTIGNSAGVAAPFLYQDTYAPAYLPGYAATIGLLYFAVAVYSTLHIYFRIVNARRERGEEDWKREGKSAGDLEEMGSNSPDYRYQI